MAALTIGKIARLADVGVETIRFYERKGLLDKPPRRESGYRQYSQDAVSRLRFIRRAKDLGFTLNEIKVLLGLRIDSTSASSCDEVRKLAEEKIACVRDKIRTLQWIEEVLVQLAGDCRNRAVASDCPILDALEQEKSHGNNQTEPRPAD